MKLTKLRIPCLLLAVLMLFSLAACGQNKTADPNVLNIGEYELRYKGAKIMEDWDENNALVLTLDFTNNSKTRSSYVLSILETAIQNGEELEYAIVYKDMESVEMVTDGQITEVEPGETIELHSAFVLTDQTSKVEIKFEALFSQGSETITVDPSTLSRESTGGSTAGDNTAEPPVGDGWEQPVGDSLLLRDWWNGDWYGWWMMTGCWGSYEEMEGSWWDICGTIDIDEDGVGTVTLWDEDYTKSEPMVSVSVSLNEAGTGELGTLMSEGGWFMDAAIEHADWIVDPDLVDYENMIHIDGYYENGDDAFSYDIYLRPWGTYWDDVDEEDLPAFYHNWYLPLMESGESMPDSIG